MNRVISTGCSRRCREGPDEDVDVARRIADRPARAPGTGAAAARFHRESLPRPRRHPVKKDQNTAGDGLDDLEEAARLQLSREEIGALYAAPVEFPILLVYDRVMDVP